MLLLLLLYPSPIDIGDESGGRDNVVEEEEDAGVLKTFPVNNTSMTNNPNAIFSEIFVYPVIFIKFSFHLMIKFAMTFLPINTHGFLALIPSIQSGEDVASSRPNREKRMNSFWNPIMMNRPTKRYKPMSNNCTNMATPNNA